MPSKRPRTSSDSFHRRIAPAATAATGIALNWQYTPNAPACTSTLKNCQSGFTATRTDVTPNVVILTPSQLGPTATSGTWTPAGGLPFGTIVISLVANGYDLNGNALVSTPATVSVTNGLTTLNPPTGLTGAVN